MAKCKVCQKEMRVGVSCIPTKLEFAKRFTTPGKTHLSDRKHAVVFERVLNGSERRYGAVDKALGIDGHKVPCHDCNAPVGGFHHPGCDVEECPRCHLQAIGCGCIDTHRISDVLVSEAGK